MKKLLILIFLSAAIFLVSACDGKAAKPPENDDVHSFSPSYEQVINGMDYDRNFSSKIQVSVTGKVERTYFLQTTHEDGNYVVTVSDGKISTFEKSGSYIQVKNYMLSAYKNGGFDGFLEHLVFTPIKNLFNLNQQTVRDVDVSQGADNVTTYILDIYEGEVKNALPILDKEFNSLEDVKDLRLEISVGGARKAVNVKIIALYKSTNGDSTITLDISYDEIIKVIE